VTTYVQTAADDPDTAPKPPDSDRSRAENNLARKLVAPALVLMLLVTAFPMLRALYLSMTRSSSGSRTTRLP
jgi:trehalose/maltose transport system permease protein